MPKLLDQLETACSENNAAKIISTAIKVVGAVHEGVIVELPCKVGGDVFWIDETGSYPAEVKCEEHGIHGIVIRKDGIYLESADGSIDKIGTAYAFVTREAAEERLESEK